MVLGYIHKNILKIKIKTPSHIRQPNKQLPATLTPLAGALLSETSDMQDRVLDLCDQNRILDLCDQNRKMKLELQQVQKESDSMAALANKKYDDLVKHFFKKKKKKT